MTQALNLGFKSLLHPSRFVSSKIFPRFHFRRVFSFSHSLSLFPRVNVHFCLCLFARTIWNSKSFAVGRRNLRITTTFVSVNVTTMGSKRSISSFSAPKFPINEDGKDKKLKGLNSASPDCNGVKSCSLEIQSFKDDPARIEAMTVQELRTTLRSVSIPPKGNKPDLISAFKCYMEKKINAESSLEVEEKETLISSEDIATLKDQILSDEVVVKDFDTIPKSPGPRQRKRKSKQSPLDGESVKVKTTTMTAKKNVSIESNEVSGGNIIKTVKKVSSENVSSITNESWTVLAHKKPQKEWIPYNPRTMRPPPLTRDTEFVKLLSWNVNGLRALLKLEGFSALQLSQREDFDVLCLQETKLQEKDVEDIRKCLIDGYDNSFWTCSVSKLGYSGTAIISRVKPLSVRYGLGISDHDSEGRLVTAEFDSFYLLSGYVPNSGDGLKRLPYRVTQWDPSLGNYMKELEKSKPVILTGDLNCAHQEIDIYNPAGNKRSAGFTEEERQSFGTNFLSKGFVDTFRKQHPGVVGYTYWGYRHGGRKTNKGWRLDYFLVSDSIAEKVHDSYILPDVLGSDHCPIGLVLKL